MLKKIQTVLPANINITRLPPATEEVIRRAHRLSPGELGATDTEEEARERRYRLMREEQEDERPAATVPVPNVLTRVVDNDR